MNLAAQILEGKLEDLPDMGEAEDVMKKFKLDDEARRKLVRVVIVAVCGCEVQIVLQRADDSSRVLGRLEARTGRGLEGRCGDAKPEVTVNSPCTKGEG